MAVATVDSIAGAHALAPVDTEYDYSQLAPGVGAVEGSVARLWLISLEPLEIENHQLVAG